MGYARNVQTKQFPFGVRPIPQPFLCLRFHGQALLFYTMNGYIFLVDKKLKIIWNNISLRIITSGGKTDATYTLNCRR